MMNILVGFMLFLDLSLTGNCLPFVSAIVFMSKWRISWRFKIL